MGNAKKPNNFENFDPSYVQISRKEFAQILGRSLSDLDRLRREDPRCPQALKRGNIPQSPVFFILKDCYTYSKLLIDDAHDLALKEELANQQDGSHTSGADGFR